MSDQNVVYPPVAVEVLNRELTQHQTNDANKQIRLVSDQPDPNNGNAAHHYEATYGSYGVHLAFQHGPIGEVGVNGITNEVLLAIVCDRLRGFQSSKYACRENALALTKLEEAAMWLESRTKARTQRGVEGTHKV